MWWQYFCFWIDPKGACPGNSRAGGLEAWEIWNPCPGETKQRAELWDISLPAKSPNRAQHPSFPSDRVTGAWSPHERKRFRSTFSQKRKRSKGKGAWTFLHPAHCVLWSLCERPKSAWLPRSWALQRPASCCCHPVSAACSEGPRVGFLHQHFSCTLYGTRSFMLLHLCLAGFSGPEILHLPIKMLCSLEDNEIIGPPLGFFLHCHLCEYHAAHGSAFLSSPTLSLAYRF